MRSFIFIAGILLLFSCKKEELSPVVYGLVIDKGNGLPIAGATVLLEKSEWIENEEVFIEMAQVTADLHGRFEINRSAGYEFVSSEMEFYRSIDHNRMPISPQRDLTLELSGQAWLQIRVLNVGEKAEDDLLLLYPRFIHTSPLPEIFNGGEIDQIVTGEVRANEIWNIRWRSFHNGVMDYHQEQAVCELGDTTFFLLTY